MITVEGWAGDMDCWEVGSEISTAVARGGDKCVVCTWCSYIRRHSRHA